MAQAEPEWADPLDVLKQGAACRGLGAVMFPTSTGSSLEVQRAKQICASCKVRKMCGEYALSHGEVFGVWGGMSESERRRIRRRRRLTGKLRG